MEIGISTWANIGVALATVILALCTAVMAFFTYKSVKASTKQTELSIKMIEKPRILEQINNLNILEDELNREIIKIEKQDLNWSKKSEKSNSDFSPLMFPISERKPFSLDIHNIFVEPDKKDNRNYSHFIDNINNNLKERRRLYLSIDGELYCIEKKILSNNFHKMIDNIFSELPQYSFNINNDFENKDSFLGDNHGGYVLSNPELCDVILGMIIVLTIDPFRTAQEISVYEGYSKLIEELYPNIINILKNQAIPDVDRRINEISGDLNELDAIDKIILKDIKELKDLYAKKYILTNGELNPFCLK
ncbi:hypothetical protein Mpet_1646 [Methanolacinia petrolearia DSM 11571]|uniref:Uncharacterized protein n=1 Tax=Methanolacinia petrolearia (strain DSM 11571 / OCM 486 / SEBR 4847) TaxID=679926 RepID=E1RH95_METP4|nr:hypothetical protein [Methanolacinia petrolearia]ADN36399.1 hypothetical protein Mpet_1646 [Methanolacinia petrolearia DSM 11571]